VLLKMECKKCFNSCVKKGKRNNIQRYYCKECKRSFQESYNYQSYEVGDSSIPVLLKEGLGFRSISRVLNISLNTVSKRILRISEIIDAPVIPKGKEFEVDEMRTYIGHKKSLFWIIYGLQKDTREVVSFHVGKRGSKHLRKVTDALLLSDSIKIFTDKYVAYKPIIPKEVHITKQYSTNRIERNNLNLRIHLKKLNRRTICYSKSLIMLSACLKIYFWG